MGVSSRGEGYGLSRNSRGRTKPSPPGPETTTYLSILPPTTRSKPISPPLPPRKVSEAPAKLECPPGGLRRYRPPPSLRRSAAAATGPGCPPDCGPAAPAAPAPSEPAFTRSSTPALPKHFLVGRSFHHIRTEAWDSWLATLTWPASHSLASHSACVRRLKPGAERGSSAGQGKGLINGSLAAQE